MSSSRPMGGEVVRTPRSGQGRGVSEKSSAFGIDFGGTGIKGAPVDLEKGDFAAERVRIKTPDPATPEAVADVFVELLEQFDDVERSEEHTSELQSH